MSKKRLAYIDAVKGIACLGVFIHHFIIKVLPATVTGKIEDSRVFGDYILGSRAIGFILNGNFWVCMFIVISAFLLSKSIMNKNVDRDLYISKTLLKRYPRLMFPVLGLNIICFIIFYIFYLCGVHLENPLNMSFASMLKMTVFDMWFIEGTSTMGYWMMYILFYGSIISVVLSTILANCKKVSYSRITLICLLPFMLYLNTYFFAVLIGVWLAYETQYTDFKFLKKCKFFNIILIIFTIIAIVFAGYPSTGNTTQGVYMIFNVLPTGLKNMVHIFHIFAAMLIMIIFICKPKLQKAFDKKCFSFLGEISYAVYLVHPVVISFIGIPLYNYLEKNIGILFSVLITTVFLIIVVIISSWLFNKFIEKPIIMIVDKMFKNVF